MESSDQLNLLLEQPATAAEPRATQNEPEVLTFSEFTARRRYDVEISHDRLRFPNGISKRQARSNREAAAHHLREAFRAARDYDAEVRAGTVRPPTEQEGTLGRLASHPDHEYVRATWRVQVKRMKRCRGLSEFAAVETIVREKMSGREPWKAELGVKGDSLEEIVRARIEWMSQDN